MSCLSLTEIDDYLEREINPEKVKSFETHLLGCAHCRFVVENRRRFLEACSRLPDLPLPLNWTKKVMAKVLSLGPTFPILLVAVIASLSFILSSLGLMVLWLRPQAPVASFNFKLSFLNLVKSAIIFLAKATLAIASSVQSFFEPLQFFFLKTNSSWPGLAFEFVAGLFVAMVIFIFLLVNCYRLYLTKERP